MCAGNRVDPKRLKEDPNLEFHAPCCITVFWFEKVGLRMSRLLVLSNSTRCWLMNLQSTSDFDKHHKSKNQSLNSRDWTYDWLPLLSKTTVEPVGKSTWKRYPLKDEDEMRSLICSSPFGTTARSVLRINQSPAFSVSMCATDESEYKPSIVWIPTVGYTNRVKTTKIHGQAISAVDPPIIISRKRKSWTNLRTSR